jgi:hypothetical protein
MHVTELSVRNCINAECHTINQNILTKENSRVRGYAYASCRICI